MCLETHQNSALLWNRNVNKNKGCKNFSHVLHDGIDHTKTSQRFFWKVGLLYTFRFPSSEMHFEASCGVFLAQKSKMPFFNAKNGIFELFLAPFVGFCQNMAFCVKKMCSGVCKILKHIQMIPKPKGLRSNITKMILNNFFEKSKFHIFWKISFFKSENFPSHFLQEMRAQNSKNWILPKNRDLVGKWFFGKLCWF